MIRNYLRMAWRLMVRQKSYTAINIFGLSIGIASSLLITIYILDELSYDRFHRDANLIYRVNFEGLMQGNEFNSALTSNGDAALRLMGNHADQIRRQKVN